MRLNVKLLILLAFLVSAAACEAAEFEIDGAKVSIPDPQGYELTLYPGHDPEGLLRTWDSKGFVAFGVAVERGMYDGELTDAALVLMFEGFVGKEHSLEEFEELFGDPESWLAIEADRFSSVHSSELREAEAGTGLAYRNTNVQPIKDVLQGDGFLIVSYVFSVPDANFESVERSSRTEANVLVNGKIVNLVLDGEFEDLDKNRAIVVAWAESILAANPLESEAARRRQLVWLALFGLLGAAGLGAFVVVKAHNARKRAQLEERLAEWDQQNPGPKLNDF